MLALGLFWLGVALVVLGLLRLFWHSFQYKKLWALISLILIVPLLIHTLLNWSSLNVRKSFYLVALGLLSITVSIAGGALSKLTFLPENKMVQTIEENIAPRVEEPLSNQAQADAAAKKVDKDGYDPLMTGSEFEPLETKEIVPEQAKKLPREAGSYVRFETVKDGQRLNAINKWIRLTMTDGKIVEGILTDVLEDSVLVESSVEGGSLGLSYRNNDIASMSVRLEAHEQITKPALNADEEQAIHESVQNNVLEQEIISPERVSEIEDEQSNTDEIESDTEVLQPKMEPVEDTSNTSQTNEVMQNIEEMVDRSKSMQNELDK